MIVQIRAFMFELLSTFRGNVTVVRLVAINSQGDILDGTNSDTIHENSEME